MQPFFVYLPAADFEFDDGIGRHLAAGDDERLIEATSFLWRIRRSPLFGKLSEIEGEELAALSPLMPHCHLVIVKTELHGGAIGRASRFHVGDFIFNSKCRSRINS